MEKPNKYDEGTKKQGRLHEDSALKKIGGDAVNLNDIAGLGHKGYQFPTFDISSSTELTSVKSHVSMPGQISEQDINCYKTDFKKMLGHNRNGPFPMGEDVKNIASLAENGHPVPTKLQGADQTKIVEYLQHETVMRIPDDHVEKMQSIITADAKQIPENFYLPGSPTEEQLSALGNRIQGSGLSSSETAEIMQNKGDSITPEKESQPDTQYDYSSGYSI